MGTGLRIGIDFDNTLINYDDVFFAMAKRSGLIGSGVPSRKQDVRDAIRKLPDGDSLGSVCKDRSMAKELPKRQWPRVSRRSFTAAASKDV
jgi:hypothetical protein